MVAVQVGKCDNEKVWLENLEIGSDDVFDEGGGDEKRKQRDRPGNNMGCGRCKALEPRNRLLVFER